MRQSLFSERMVAVALFGVVLLAYGVYIPWFGIYGDDPIYLYNYHLLGATSFPQFVAVDRPFSGWVYLLAMPLFGTTIWLYHALLLALRWLSAVFLWWVLRLIWRNHPRQVAWVAMLFAVYPGFQQQPIAIQYILHFSVLNLFLLSLATMLLAAKNPKGFAAWISLSVLSAVIGLFTMEYFAGLEFLRPVLLWAVLGQQQLDLRQRLKRTLLIWLPFLVIMGAFIYWRVVIFQFPTYQPTLLNALQENPLNALADLARRILLDLRASVYGAWRQLVGMPESGQVIFFTALVLAGLALTAFFLSRLIDRTERLEGQPWWRREWAPGALLFSLIALLVAGLPFWFGGVRLELSFPWDRSTLPYMLGSCVFVAALVDGMVKPRLQPLVIGALVGLSFGLHYQNALVYRQEWRNLQDYYQQLTWRAPQLQPGTIIASDDVQLFRFGDNGLTPLLNWTYAPEHHAASLPYKYFELSVRLGSTIPEVEKDLPVRHSYRGHNFESTTSKVLVVYQPRGGCLRVLRPKDRILPGLTEVIREALPLSNPEVIDLEGDAPAQPPAMMKAQPENDWCRFYTTAERACQSEDWQQAADIGDKAFERGLQPSDPVEYLPFIEAYARLRRWQQAGELTRLAAGDGMNPALCAIWQQVDQTLSKNPDEQAAVDALTAELACSP